MASSPGLTFTVVFFVYATLLLGADAAAKGLGQDRRSDSPCHFFKAFILDARELQRGEAQYFPFLATSPGQKCSREEVRAAIAQ